MEILANGRPAGPASVGERVVTNASSYAMPIIRYELGDVCLPSDGTCPCGSHFPLLGIVEESGGRHGPHPRRQSARPIP